MYLDKGIYVILLSHWPWPCGLLTGLVICCGKNNHYNTHYQTDKERRTRKCQPKKSVFSRFDLDPSWPPPFFPRLVSGVQLWWSFLLTFSLYLEQWTSPIQTHTRPTSGTHQSPVVTKSKAILGHGATFSALLIYSIFSAYITRLCTIYRTIVSRISRRFLVLFWVLAEVWPLEQSELFDHDGPTT